MFLPGDLQALCWEGWQDCREQKIQSVVVSAMLVSTKMMIKALPAPVSAVALVWGEGILWVICREATWCNQCLVGFRG